MAFIATLVTWFIAIEIVGQLTESLPAVELQAATGLIAVIVLLVIMNWFFHKIYWGGWIRAHTRRRKALFGSLNGEGSNLRRALILLGWGCGVRSFPLTRRCLLTYWPRCWSWALIMPHLICSADHDRTIGIRQTHAQRVRAFPKSLLVTNRWYYVFSKMLNVFSRGE